MAKFYSILQTGSGKLGNYNLRRTRAANGDTINVLSQTNKTPKNPRTYSQMWQRAKFAVAVKFFKRATSNFFKFAYEDQKSNESDYNAFMRHNVASAVPMVRDQVNNESYPAIGNLWQMAQGSLTPLLNRFNGSAFQICSTDVTSSPSTVADLSNILISAGYEEGQIFTLVVINSGMDVSLFNRLIAENMQGITTVPIWNISQIVINSSDTTPLAETSFIGTHNYFGDSLFINPMDGSNYLAVDDIPGEAVCTACGIISEKIEGSQKLKVSSAYLTGNPLYTSVLKALSQNGYINAVYNTWGATASTAILKGSLAEGTRSGGSSGSPVITSVNGSTIPATTANLTAGQAVSLALVGRNFNGDTPLEASSFETEGCDVTGISINSATSATLNVKVASTSGAFSISVSYGSTVIWNGEIAKG